MYNHEDNEYDDKIFEIIFSFLLIFFVLTSIYLSYILLKEKCNYVHIIVSILLLYLSCTCFYVFNPINIIFKVVKNSNKGNE